MLMPTKTDFSHITFVTSHNVWFPELAMIAARQGRRQWIVPLRSV
jgi:hypothetical protein